MTQILDRPAANSGAPVADGLDRLQGRFTDGQQWLADVRETLGAMSSAGVGSRLEKRFLTVLERIVHLEEQLRFIYELTTCARGSFAPCDSAAVAICSSCAGGGA